MATPNRSVFTNCPFDRDYQPLFRAIVFTVARSGFDPRCSLETDDASENRFEKICNIVAECRYGIHDISRTEIDPASRLPRFNMPLELGLFLGAKRFGRKLHGEKRCIVFDRDRYRFQAYISDISGQDIHAHNNDIRAVIITLASWLCDQSRLANVPGGRVIAAEFAAFLQALPAICDDRQLDLEELTFGDDTDMIAQYVAQSA